MQTLVRGISVIHVVEVLERLTKRPGCPNGCVTRPAVVLLRVLMFRFHNNGSGACFPSYNSLQAATGFCRATIAKALKILEALKVLKVTRRLIRVRDALGIVSARQGSNLYAFEDLPALTPIAYPERKLAKPRPRFGLGVYAVRTNNKQADKIVRQPLPWQAREGGLREVGAVKFGTGSECWRETSRRRLLNAGKAA
jgi:Helix-turn-helix domain